MAHTHMGPVVKPVSMRNLNFKCKIQGEESLVNGLEGCKGAIWLHHNEWVLMGGLHWQMESVMKWKDL